jgi:glycosyltransferase involved in cell wall biosynthesis
MAVVTTVMPVYNGAPHLGEALNSLARQSRRPDRVVVFDDCSTDRTREIVTGFKGLPCEYRLNEHNLGLFGNHNRALELAPETDYLHFLHQDDVLLQDFCERTIGLLNGVAGPGMSWCQADLIDAVGQPLPPIVAPVAGSPEPVELDEFLKERARLKADIFISGTMLKTNRQTLKCRFREEFKQVGDHYFWAELACLCVRRFRVKEVLLKCRHHPLSGTSINQTSMDAYIREDWKVIQGIEAMRGKAGLENWLRTQQLKCFFAALVHVKAQLVQERSPEYARQVAMVGRSLVALPHWWLGKSAYHLRKGLRAIQRAKEQS